MYDLVIKGGTVVTATSSQQLDVAVDGEQIVALGHDLNGNTSLDALASGLPILTSRGRFMRGRQSAFMMERLGLPGWVVPAHQLGHMAAERLGDPDQIRQARTTITAHQDQLFSSDAARPDFLAHVERLARAH